MSASVSDGGGVEAADQAVLVAPGRAGSVAVGRAVRLARDMRAISVDAAMCAAPAGNRDRFPGLPARLMRAGSHADADGTARNGKASACRPFPAVSGCLRFGYPDASFDNVANLFTIQTAFCSPAKGVRGFPREQPMPR